MADPEAHATVGIPTGCYRRLVEDPDFRVRVDLTLLEAAEVERAEVVRDAMQLVTDEVGEDDPLCRDSGIFR